MPKRFIQILQLKPGTLHRELGIPRKHKIPLSLLKKIDRARIGTNIKNPSKLGKPTLKITRLLKKRAVLATTLKSIKSQRTRRTRRK